jgi:radical SAM protein with 4Fe4S-binding SPASM domain
MPFQVARMTARRRANLARAGLNLIYRRDTPWSMPLHMQFELANVCPLRCPVCPTGLGELSRPPAFMDPELFERLFDEVGPYLLTASLWCWGEPLLHPALSRILAAARRHPVATLLSTSGQMLADPRVIDALLAHPPTHLIVALDGLTDETNQRFRRGARLAPVVEGVARLAAAKRATGQRLPLLHLRYMVMEHNEGEVCRVTDFARASGFDGLTIRTLLIVASDRAMAHHAALEPHVQDYRAYARTDARTVSRPGFLCLQPSWFPSVFADGTVVACEQDFNADRPLGRVTATWGFQDVWYSAGAARQRRAIKADHRRTIGFCARCPFASRCRTDVSSAYVDLSGAPSRPPLIGS